MNITEAFEVLKRHGHVFDQYEFDDRWLGKQRGHFAYLKSTDSHPSIETLMRFHFRLKEASKVFSTYGLDTGELGELANKALSEIRIRCT